MWAELLVVDRRHAAVKRDFCRLPKLHSSSNPFCTEKRETTLRWNATKHRVHVFVLMLAKMPNAASRGQRAAAHLGARVPALDPQLVDLGLGDVRSLVGLVQLVLLLAELAQVDVSLLLLFWGDERKKQRCRDTPTLGPLKPDQDSHLRTYGLFRGSLVGFHFQLQLIHQILESGDILAVLLGLCEKHTAL